MWITFFFDLISQSKNDLERGDGHHLAVDIF